MWLLVRTKSALSSFVAFSICTQRITLLWCKCTRVQTCLLQLYPRKFHLCMRFHACFIGWCWLVARPLQRTVWFIPSKLRGTALKANHQWIFHLVMDVLLKTTASLSWKLLLLWYATQKVRKQLYGKVTQSLFGSKWNSLAESYLIFLSSFFTASNSSYSYWRSEINENFQI